MSADIKEIRDRVLAARERAEAAFEPAPQEYLAMPSTWTTFCGPCPHGRNPFTRCDVTDDPAHGGCGELSFGEARWLAEVLAERRFTLADDVAPLAADVLALAERVEQQEETIANLLDEVDAGRCAARLALEGANEGTAEAARWQKVAEVMIGALRAVRADRPSAHSDAVWGSVLDAIDAYEKEVR